MSLAVFQLQIARLLLAALYVCLPVRAHWPLKDKTGNVAARCQLPVANRGCNEAVNATPRHDTAATAEAAAQRAQTLARRT